MMMNWRILLGARWSVGRLGTSEHAWFLPTRYQASRMQ